MLIEFTLKLKKKKMNKTLYRYGTVEYRQTSESITMDNIFFIYSYFKLY